MSEANDLSYPTKADANGTAKKYYRRRAYYFGRHNTPESLILFGEWKRRLIESGDPPEVKCVRIDLEHSMEQQARVKYRAYIWPAVTAFSSMVLALAITTSASIFSTRAVPKVDGSPLTVEETLYVRGLRQYAGMRARTALDRPQRVAELYARIKQLRPDDEPIHDTSVEF